MLHFVYSLFTIFTIEIDGRKNSRWNQDKSNMQEYSDWIFLVKSNDTPKELFTEIRKYRHYKVEEVLTLCDISKNTYDRIMANKKISKASAIKICIGLKLDYFLMVKFTTITGNYLNIYDFEDYKLLRKYQESIEKSISL